MEIRNFKTFKAIVEQGSFVKAAKSLNYAQSSVTSHIRAIEDYFEQPIFDRIGKRIILNSFGKKVHARAIKLLEEYDLVCELKTKTDEPSGKLRIGAPESALMYRLHSTLKQYMEKHPNVEIVLHNPISPHMKSGLRKGELDVAVLLEKRVTDPELHVEELFEEKMSVVAPRDFHGDPLALAEKHSVIYTLEGCGYRDIFRNLLKEKGIQAENIIETGSVEIIKQWVSRGAGISFIPTITARKEIDAGEILHFPWHGDDPVLIQITYHKDKRVTPAMRELVRLLVENAKDW